MYRRWIILLFSIALLGLLPTTWFGFRAYVGSLEVASWEAVCEVDVLFIEQVVEALSSRNQPLEIGYGGQHPNNSIGINVRARKSDDWELIDIPRDSELQSAVNTLQQNFPDQQDSAAQRAMRRIEQQLRDNSTTMSMEEFLGGTPFCIAPRELVRPYRDTLDIFFGLGVVPLGAFLMGLLSGLIRWLFVGRWKWS